MAAQEGRVVAGEPPCCSYGRGACFGKGWWCNASIAFASEKVKNWICSWIAVAVSFVWVEWKIALSRISASPQFKPRRSKTRPQCNLAQTQSCSELSPAASRDGRSSPQQPCASPVWRTRVQSEVKGEEKQSSRLCQEELRIIFIRQPGWGPRIEMLMWQWNKFYKCSLEWRGRCKQLIGFIIFNFRFIFKCKTFFMHKCKNMQTESKNYMWIFILIWKRLKGYCWKNHWGKWFFWSKKMQAMSV